MKSVRLASASILLPVVLIGCAAARSPARARPPYFLAAIIEPASPALEPTPEPAAEAPAEASSPDVTDTRLAEEACLCISRSTSVTTVELEDGVRLVLRPHHMSDMERLQRRISALEGAPDSGDCPLPGLLRSALVVESRVVAGTLRIDFIAPVGHRTEMRRRVRGFASSVGRYGVVAAEAPTSAGGR